MLRMEFPKTLSLIVLVTVGYLQARRKQDIVSLNSPSGLCTQFDKRIGLGNVITH